MSPTEHALFLGELRQLLTTSPSDRFALVGYTPLALELEAFFRDCGEEARLLGIFAVQGPAARVKPLAALGEHQPEVVIIAGDEEKETLLEQALPWLQPRTLVRFGGYGHFQFQDPVFRQILYSAFVPSLANGYPHTLTHIYQILSNAARLQLQGVVVEFGMFKGGTTYLLSRFVEALGRDWKVIGFDTFHGFPERRSPLDMYAHPDCVFKDEQAVRGSLAHRRIEVVTGDVCATAKRLSEEEIVLAFVDTDNYSSARAILDVIQDRVVVNGAIVFDHFTGRDRHKYTLGERLAAKALLADPRYFHLHDTGVFYRQR